MNGLKLGVGGIDCVKHAIVLVQGQVQSGILGQTFDRFVKREALPGLQCVDLLLSLVGPEVILDLKTDIQLFLHSCDFFVGNLLGYLLLKLMQVQEINPEKVPLLDYIAQRLD